MTARRIVIYGNAGSGKSTMARRLAAEFGLALLAMDDIAWVEAAEPTRRAHDVAVADLLAFFRKHRNWVIEGCYGDLVEAALPHCTELRFLNPGVEACVANCRRRPWEPDKYETPDDQNSAQQTLIDWVRLYETLDDDCGYARHRAIFDAFTGPKREFR